MLQSNDKFHTKFLSTLLLIGLFTFVIPARVFIHSRLLGAPAVMLWAWERPEDLRTFADSNNIGAAFLAATISLAGDNVSVHERQQPLLCVNGYYLMPVVRIETDRQNPPNFSAEQVDKIVNQVLRIVARPTYHGLQIDFDANRGQRTPYKTILTKLRQALPAELPLSMTAIASWCSGDYWLADLPVDEVVPMYFDMGVSPSSKWQYIKDISDSKQNDGRRNCKCHSALGVATSEPMKLRPSQYSRKRIYFFSHHSWQMASDKEKAEITKILKYTEAS